jgi:3-dehydroquinate synthase
MSGIKERKVKVGLGDRSYVVHVAPGSLAKAGTYVAGLGHAGHALVVSAPPVADRYASPLVDSLASAGVRVSSVLLPDGETSKTLTTVERIYDAAFVAGIDRWTIVVALGGGVVGDISGFAAATLLRGLRWVMVPTTLLAQVDSSVGGKTGVNREQGKNLVGAFHQPVLVVSDPRTLATLEEREYRAGLAEVVKYAMILDGELFGLLEREAEAVLARDTGLLTDIVARCVELKSSIVERDEREAGPRRILNFGHTIGHAVEQATGYSRYLHGEAVAMGMMAATRLSITLGACEPAIAARLGQLLTRFGLPAALPADLPSERLLTAIARDKKADGGKVRFILCEALGRCREQALTAAQMSAAL